MTDTKKRDGSDGLHELAGSVSSLVVQKDDQIRALRQQNDWLHHKMLTYLVEIQKCNKGLRRLNKRLEKKQNRDIYGK